MTDEIPRGLRVHNPGNIRQSAVSFIGEVKPSADDEFKQFSDDLHGLRAIGRILLHYHVLGFNSVSRIIDRWAPPEENNTASYINTVAVWTGFDPDQTINLADPSVLQEMITAIVREEQGVQPFDDATLNAAATAALEPS